MTDSYSVVVTTQAEEQIHEIVYYIAYSLHALNAALRMLDIFEKEIASLSCLPHRVTLTTEEPWRSYGIRKLTVKNYQVYFWIDEATSKVNVTAVVYGRRDQIKQLLEMHI